MNKDTTPVNLRICFNCKKTFPYKKNIYYCSNKCIKKDIYHYINLFKRFY